MRSKLFRIILAVVYIPMASEVLFRIVAPVPIMPRYVVSMPYGVRGNMPNAFYEHKTAEYRISIRTNSKGIRAEREIQYLKPSNLKRVLVLGDSFGLGYGVNLEESFTERMRYKLKKDYEVSVEVINLSTSGHGTAEEFITMVNEGFKYEPDLVLLAWHNTDLDDNVRSNLFQLVDGQLKKKADFYLPAVKEREILNRLLIYRWLGENSQTYNFFRNWAGKNAKKWLVKNRFKKESQKNISEKMNQISKNEYKGKLAISLLKKIQTECYLKKCKFLILDIPLRVSRREFVSTFPFEYAKGDENFHFVSPIDKFKERIGEQIYWERGDGHFTPLGCNLVGEILAEYIENHNLLGP